MERKREREKCQPFRLTHWKRWRGTPTSSSLQSLKIIPTPFSSFPNDKPQNVLKLCTLKKTHCMCRYLIKQHWTSTSNGRKREKDGQLQMKWSSLSDSFNWERAHRLSRVTHSALGRDSSSLFRQISNVNCEMSTEVLQQQHQQLPSIPSSASAASTATSPSSSSAVVAGRR